MSARAALALLAVGSALCACQPDFNVPVAGPKVDEPYFRCHVQPVLTKNCSMFACHGADGTNGTGARYFQLYARSRLRPAALPEAMRNSTFTQAEYAANFAAAADMINLDSPDDSLLLRKPLDQSAGGYFHRGADLYGQGNVFLSRDDPDYVVLAAWVHGTTEVPQCIEPGSNL